MHNKQKTKLNRLNEHRKTDKYSLLQSKSN